VTITGFDRNVLPFLSVLVFSGMKTGSIRAPAKSNETDFSVKVFSPELFKKTSLPSFKFFEYLSFEFEFEYFANLLQITKKVI
jgi:hypothetical protein